MANKKAMRWKTLLVFCQLALVPMLPSNGQGMTCSPDMEFTCEDGTCISEEKTCNGNNDCTQSEDERHCYISETIVVATAFQFTSVNYPSNYISNHRTETIFSTSEDSQLFLTLDFIHIELDFDQFLVGNGNIPYVQPLLIWSGGPAVDSIKVLSSGSSLWIVFITDFSVTMKGYSGTVQSVQKSDNGIDCADNFDCRNGVCIPEEFACDYQIHCANYFDEGFCFGEMSTRKTSTSTDLSTYKTTKVKEFSTTVTASTTATPSSAFTASTTSTLSEASATSSASTTSTATPPKRDSTSIGYTVIKPSTATYSQPAHSTITLAENSRITTSSTRQQTAITDMCSLPGPLPVNLFVDPKANEYDDGTSIRYLCRDGFITNGNSKALCMSGEWLPSSVPWCEAFDEFEMTLVDITDSLSNQNITTKDVEMAANTIEKATKSKEFLKSDVRLVELIASSLESVVEAGEPSVNVTDPVVQTINNLMDVDPSLLKKSKTKTGRFVVALEKQISNLQTIKGNYSRILENVGVSALKINSSRVEKTLGLATVDPDYDRTLLEEDKIQANIQTFLEREDFPIRETTASISLPKSAVGLVAEADGINSQEIPVSFIVYSNPKLFSPTKPPESSEMVNDLRSVVNEYIGSRIISARVEHANVSDTILSAESAVVAKFKTDSLQEVNDTVTERDCVFWSYDKKTQEGFWSNDGCFKMPDELDLTVCSCNRFAIFAVLIRIRQQQRALSATVPLYYVTLIGSVVSGACLVLCIITLLSFKELRARQTTYIHINICISLLGFYAAFFLSTVADTIGPVTCAVTSAVVHFFALTPLAWMSVEAINILLSLVKINKTNFSYFMPIACVFGYGCPVVVVLVLVALLDLASNYGNTSFCFLQSGYALLFGFLVEVLVLFLFNCIVFTCIILKMFYRPRYMTRTSGYVRFSESIIRVQHGVLFWFLFLVSWVFAYLSVTDKEKPIYELFYAIIVGLQGLATFSLLCFASPTTRQLFTKVKHENQFSSGELQEVTASPRASTSHVMPEDEPDIKVNVNDTNA